MQLDIKYFTKYSLLLTFFQHSECLAVWKNAFYINPDGTLGRIFSTDDSEAETFLPRTFLKHHVLDAVTLTFSLAWQGAELGAFGSLKIRECDKKSFPDRLSS